MIHICVLSATTIHLNICLLTLFNVYLQHSRFLGVGGNGLSKFLNSSV